MRRNGRGRLDVYLLPAVVGGGLGDIEEVLLAGRRLSRAGFPIYLCRAPGRPLPRSVEGPWEWPPLNRVVAPPEDRAPRALTLSAWWGVVAAPPRDGPYGRAGPWAEECREIEAAYGAGRVVHVSFEEFARTLTSRQQTAERWREGGVPVRALRERLRRATAEVSEFARAYARFRAFDRADLLHLFPSFSYSSAFQREFPEAVQCGPFWPERSTHRRPRRGRWVWYASPGSSPALARSLATHWPAGGRPVTVAVRMPVPFSFPVPGAPGLVFKPLPMMSPAAWHRELDRAEIRIITGSRTLLEAIRSGRPFLYYNGVTGSGRGSRRHRPEKIDSLLRLWRRQRVPAFLLRDLANFARGRDLARIVARARDDRSWRQAFPRPSRPGPFPPGCADGGRLLDRFARGFADGALSAEEAVAALRQSARRAVAGGPVRRHPTSL
ncbi:MAG: hypothetical protein ACYDFT_02580 [Thermoplasmata archaeon]